MVNELIQRNQELTSRRALSNGDCLPNLPQPATAQFGLAPVSKFNIHHDTSLDIETHFFILHPGMHEEGN